MDKDNKDNKKKSKQSTKTTIFKSFKIFLIVILILGVVGAGAAGGVVLSILKDAPKIDPTNINSSLDQTSFILSPDGELIEKIQAPEFRTVVPLSQIPVHLQEAFIAIEDERFRTHIGVDPKGIVSSAMDNIKAGGIVRGASTITQQLVKNVYLTNEKKWDRKIKEAYLALQIEKVLTKDQILELYLNRIYLGQNAYGVQEAAQTYFSKDVGDLTLAESAVLAGIVKSTTKFAPYEVLRPENFDDNKHHQVGQLEILGEKYIAIYNDEAVKRQQLILKKMLDLEKISSSEYDTALNESIKDNLNPAQRKIDDLTSYFSDYVKTQVVDALVEKLGYTKEQAQDELYSGGLKIYSTVDLKLQRELENIYNNFTEILVGSSNKIRGPILVDWRLNKSKDIIDENNKIIFYNKDNLFNENFELRLGKGSYELRDGDLYIKNPRLTPFKKHIDIADYYTIDEKKNLVTHTVGSFVMPEDQFSVDDNKEIRIKSSFLTKTEDFYRIDENENLLINEKYFFRSAQGIVQPQSATVVLDYRTGEIKALVGGRDVMQSGSILNRATASKRQPGSAMKPIAAYLPALDSGYTAASPIDDIPFYANGQLWPKNWYKGYRGIHSLRRSVEQSVNVNSVKIVDQIGVKTSMDYLERLGIISKTNPENDSFVTAAESGTNDENLSALGLGGMTAGLTPLEITAAYGAIANDGVYKKPIAFSKIEDKNGNILIDNIPKENIVVSPQIAYIMSDILRTTVSNGIAGRAKLSNMAVGGKTGTTQNQADIWFVGFTPYYATGVWIGNDSPKITLSNNSGTAVKLWQHINTRIHEGLEGKTSFNKPDGIVSVNICTQSGQLATELCTRDPRGSTVKSEIFVKGTEPKQTCDVHVQRIIDSSNGKIANEFCPIGNLETRVFIERTPPYFPSEHNGIVPSDFGFTAPNQVCTDHNEGTLIIEPPEDDFEFPLDPDEDFPLDSDGNNNNNNGNGNGNVNGNNDDDN